MTTLCYADGGCSGNGTKDAKAYGSYSINGLVTMFDLPESTTNNESEYNTLLALLTELDSKGIRDASIKMDSRLVVEQVNGRWKVREFRLMQMRDLAAKLLKDTGASLEWVGREQIVAVLGH